MARRAGHPCYYSPMLEHSEFEGVHYWKVARSYFGKSLYTTGFYLLDEVLIDCGPPNARRQLIPLFRDLPAKRILITHHHEDHTGNAAFLARTRGLPVSGHRDGCGSLELISRGIPFYRRVVWGVPDAFPYSTAPESQETSKHLLQALETPGHSRDHLCFFVEKKGWLFTGDLYLSGYLRYLREDEDIHALMYALRRMIQLKPRVIFCNHRGPVLDGEKALGKKLAFLEQLRDRVMEGAGRGLSPEELARSLMKKDLFFRHFSGGEFSSLNLIRALVGSDRGAEIRGGSKN